ncbi:protein involved in sex pheromone biosynthesis [Bacillus pakistanensis]|uniref:Protein involved in sex pheromone biosynthesis n=1 Tax=Rossellomorea pakistanensis TaxID=992288 RepID=A0ABS2NID7_9BACI|nr:CamS family sex pheromone protein [Bacillus pakistanensis]MBM7587583.1 protein involved in sex pheromone biosynthesis [Bacillus pakistanensis]
MKKWLVATLCSVVLLGGCAPTFEKQEQVVEEDENNQTVKAIIPSFQISDHYYKTLLPYESSATRGLVVNNLHSRYDIDQFEAGLTRMAKERFPTDKFLFKEGQTLDKKTVESWLNRKFTSEQLKERGLKESQNVGLNPVDDGSNKSPIYLSHIIEHSYLQKTAEDKVQLGGVVIGLALNSVHYYQNESTGTTIEDPISNDVIKQQGNQIAQEVVKRLRGKEELQGVPITVALYKQASSNSATPGHFFAYTNIEGNESSIAEWKAVNEQFYLFPSTEAEQAHSQDLKYFLNFKEKVENYFPNYNGVVGKAFYQNGKISTLNIDIPIQYHGKAETIGFTQYVADLANKEFPKELNLELTITSSNGPEALIVKKANKNDPMVHIYE